MTLSSEALAEIRNKLQAPFSVLSALDEGKQPSSEAVKTAKKGLEDIIRIINKAKD